MDDVIIARRGENFWDKPWIYLVWLGFLVIPASGLNARDWVATAVAAAIFVPIYLWSFKRRGWQLWLGRAAMLGLSVALFPYNSYAHVFFIYAGLPAQRASIRESLTIMLLTVALSFLYFYLQRLDVVYFAVDGLMILGLGGGMLYAEVDEKSRATIAVKDQEIQRLAKFAERERIARDLHDLLGHTLSLIALKAELAYKLVPQEGARAAQEMREVAGAARKALTDVRQAIAGLRSIGLLDAVKTADILLRAAGVQTQLRLCALPALSGVQEQALAQAVIEAATNIVRHAEATQASIGLSVSDAKLEMIIEDDGRADDIVPGSGLSGMRARLEAVRGELLISKLKPGLRVTAVVRAAPLPAAS
jgi:two-component system sensor histidine kinase DesK